MLAGILDRILDAARYWKQPSAGSSIFGVNHPLRTFSKFRLPASPPGIYPMMSRTDSAASGESWEALTMSASIRRSFSARSAVCQSNTPNSLASESKSRRCFARLAVDCDDIFTTAAALPRSAPTRSGRRCRLLPPPDRPSYCSGSNPGTAPGSGPLEERMVLSDGWWFGEVMPFNESESYSEMGSSASFLVPTEATANTHACPREPASTPSRLLARDRFELDRYRSTNVHPQKSTSPSPQLM